LVTAASVFLGSAILVPITEVGSLASACGWLAACVAYFCMQSAPVQRTIAAVGALVSLIFIAMKLLPFVPGHFTLAEWIVLVLWIALGFLINLSGVKQASAAPAELGLEKFKAHHRDGAQQNATKKLNADKR